MKDDNKTKKQLIHELTELRLQKAAFPSIEDITRRCTQLEENNKLLASIVEFADDAIIVKDLDGIIVSWNHGAEVIYGYTAKEAIGRSISLIMPPATPDDYKEILAKVAGGESVDHYETQRKRKNGRIIDISVTISPVKDASGKIISASAIARDITEYKRMEALLKESEEQYRRLFETANDGIVLLEKGEGKITHANPAAEKMLGYTKEESIGNKLQDIGIPIDTADFKTIIQNLDENGIINYSAVPVKTKSGRHIDTVIYLVDRALLVQCNIRDVTERKRVEDALRESEEKYRWLVNNMADVITAMDMNLRFTYISPSIMRLRGYTPEEALAQTLEEVMTPESLQITVRAFEEEMKLEAGGTADPDRVRILELEQYRKDGSTVLIENHLSFMRDEAKKPVGIISVSHDITARKRAEEELRASEAKLTNAMEMALLGHWEYDIASDLFTFNDQFYKIFRTTVDQVGGYTMHSAEYAHRFVHPDDMDMVGEETRKAIETTDPHFNRQIEHRILYADGEVGYITVRFFIVKDSRGRTVKTYGVNHDITERKRTEEKLAHSYDLLTKLARQVPGVIYQYRLYPDGRSAFPYSSPGMNDIYEVTPEDVQYDATPVFGRLHPDDYDRVAADIQESARTLQMFHCEFRVILPRQGLRWLWSQAHPERLFDGSILWHGIISDITERKQIEEQLQKTLENLRKAFIASIQLLVSAVEARDPYTAGHQIRATNLARAIATEMGLPRERIEGLRMAGSIHDIGKLSVPSEILSKPTKLTDIEYSLIKEHSRKGYEMLKNVESPWSLAEIVYQHHERMDGSGYPRNLKGDEILMEARILAVSDVVESMATHRPYRPAIGIEEALEEIEKNKGILYDDAVADACLRLFREKRFQL